MNFSIECTVPILLHTSSFLSRSSLPLLFTCSIRSRLQLIPYRLADANLLDVANQPHSLPTLVVMMSCGDDENKIDIWKIWKTEESSPMRKALEEMLIAEDSVISHELIQGLLSKPSYEPQPSKVYYFDSDLDLTTLALDGDDQFLWNKLQGFPRMPFYCELSHRLKLILQHRSERCNPFLPASHFGMSDQQCINELVNASNIPQAINSVEECTKWLRAAGSAGIFAVLGCRRTIGSVKYPSTQQNKDILDEVDNSEMYLLPPSIDQLICSSRKFHKPNSKSQLTVAARALAKHAHRGEEGFFGMIKGSESEKNHHAEAVVQTILSQAAWINIHCFGGVHESRPVIEVRTERGYGARWSAVWRDSLISPEEVEFRGFLEPQMDGGHERRWRH